MAPNTNYTNVFGTVGNYTVAANERPAGTLEDNHLGFVCAVSVAGSNGVPVEVAVQAAHPDGFRTSIAIGNALVKALHVVTGA